MNARRKGIPSEEGLRLLEILRQSVGKALEKKRRLGHYSVVWKDGKPLLMGDDLNAVKKASP
mgnify:CR=1 FL=1